MVAAKNNTADAILDLAQLLCQERGFNGFSFRDLSSELGIKSSSVHYHFATKEDLGEALVQRYHKVFAAKLAQLSESGSPAAERLTAFAHSMGELLQEGSRMCLCGMLASDRETLPDRVKRAVAEFFAEGELWIEHTMRDGLRDGSLSSSADPRLLSQLLMAGLQGLVLVARAHGDASRFRPGAHLLMRSLGVTQI